MGLEYQPLTTNLRGGVLTFNMNLQGGGEAIFFLYNFSDFPMKNRGGTNL